MNRMLMAALAGALILGACEDKSKQAIASATPATGTSLQEHSRKISRTVSLTNDADLVQRFCKNTLSAPCPPDIAEKLKSFGFADNQTGVDLAYAFALMAADAKDGKPDLASTDEDFLVAAYHVALGRDPDESGAQANLAFIKQKGERQLMLRSLLESAEFKTQP